MKQGTKEFIVMFFMIWIWFLFLSVLVTYAYNPWPFSQSAWSLYGALFTLSTSFALFVSIIESENAIEGSERE